MNLHRLFQFRFGIKLLISILLLLVGIWVWERWGEDEEELIVNNLKEKRHFNFNDTEISMDDPELIAEIRSRLIPPSKKPLNLEGRKVVENPSAGQVQTVESILRGLDSPSPFFVECGAFDGYTGSNTFWIEQNLPKWSGLLIEADPVHFKTLQSMNRNSWSGQFCLSNSGYSKELPFFQSYDGGQAGGLIKSKIWSKSTGHLVVPCFPLYSVLLAVNRTTVDFFSLDVEGSELDILRTLPFDKVIFKVMTIEHLLLKGKKKELREFLEGKGYIFYCTAGVGDSIFIHKSIVLTEEQKLSLGHEVPEVNVDPRI